MCVLEILHGVLLLIDPLGFTSSIIIALGAALIVAGVVFAVRLSPDYRGGLRHHRHCPRR